MALANSERQRRKLAAMEHAQKLKLERRLIMELREFFNQLSADFRLRYAQDGTVVNASDYSVDLSGLLSRNYRRVARSFESGITKFLQRNLKNQDPLVQNLSAIAEAEGTTVGGFIAQIRSNVIRQSNEFISTNVEVDSQRVTNTNSEQLAAAVTFATVTLRNKLGREPNSTEVAKLAADKFKANSISRSNTIASTGVQKVAESTKDSELNELLKIRNSPEARGIAPPLEDDSQWVTMGDKKVRRGQFSHVEADSQRRVNGVYTVGGEQLRFPGDTSLGASVGNIANCRCSSVAGLNDTIQPEF